MSNAQKDSFEKKSNSIILKPDSYSVYPPNSCMKRVVKKNTTEKNTTTISVKKSGIRMKTAYFQFAPEFGNVPANLKKIAAACTGQIDLLVLPELATSGYQFVSKDEVAACAEKIPGSASVEFFTDLARKIGGTVIAGLPEKDGEHFYNSAVAVNENGLIGKYRKIHLFYEERDFFTPGGEPAPVFDIGPAKIGLMICFDWIFPEISRSLALQGAQILCLPANLVLPFCQRAMITRAIENRVFTVVANRIGWEKRGDKKMLSFTGGSQIADPQGELLASAPADKPEFKFVELDPAAANDKWVTERNNVFEDRKPELYQL